MMISGSMTIPCQGDLPASITGQSLDGRSIPAITWGHCKDHRSDLM